MMKTYSRIGLPIGFNPGYKMGLFSHELGGCVHLYLINSKAESWDIYIRRLRERKLDDGSIEYIWLPTDFNSGCRIGPFSHELGGCVHLYFKDK